MASAPTVMEDGVARVDVDLFDDGLLWLINRTVFHPRGYALAVGLDDDGKISGFELWGNGDEPWQFGADIQENERFAAVEQVLEALRVTARAVR